jgi:hypothetical protein
MINTGLPYKLEEITEISETGAAVDMSDVNFPGIDDDKQIATALIFLRNTGFKNVSLDFSKCDYETKCKYLTEYLTSEILCCRNHNRSC